MTKTTALRGAWMMAFLLVAWASASAQSILNGTQSSSGSVPKQVHLVMDGSKIMASNVRLNRFDELRLEAQERMREQRVGEAVAVVITNRRIIAYGVVSGWRSMDRIPNEQIESVSAQDYAALIVTSVRMVNFNGETGVWGEQRRNINR
jgi:hypothetical protein